MHKYNNSKNTGCSEGKKNEEKRKKIWLIWQKKKESFSLQAFILCSILPVRDGMMKTIVC